MLVPTRYLPSVNITACFRAFCMADWALLKIALVTVTKERSAAGNFLARLGKRVRHRIFRE